MAYTTRINLIAETLIKELLIRIEVHKRLEVCGLIFLAVQILSPLPFKIISLPIQIRGAGILTLTSLPSFLVPL